MTNTSAKQPTIHELTIDALKAVQDEYDKYIIFPHDEARDAVVLWVLHAHIFRAFDATPRLSVRSREPGSGKSRVLELIEHLTPNPLNAVDIEPAVLWRKIEHGNPTILIDEADTIFGKSGSDSAHRRLRGIINAGHRASAVVARCVGAEAVREFHVFSPVALAGIGRLPETIATRSVEIVMRKRQPGDREVRPFRLRFAIDDLRLAKKVVEEWATHAYKPLTTMLPDLPVGERAADVWEPLVAVADLAGDEWGKRARAACERLVREAAEKPVTVGVKLLRAIHTAFGDETQLSTTDLMDRLYSDPEGTWVEGVFSSRDMARFLKEFDIRSQTIRVDGDPVRGYKATSFENAWSDHL